MSARIGLRAQLPRAISGRKLVPYCSSVPNVLIMNEAMKCVFDHVTRERDPAARQLFAISAYVGHVEPRRLLLGIVVPTDRARAFCRRSGTGTRPLRRIAPRSAARPFPTKSRIGRRILLALGYVDALTCATPRSSPQARHEAQVRPRFFEPEQRLLEPLTSSWLSATRRCVGPELVDDLLGASIWFSGSPRWWQQGAARSRRPS